MGMAQLSWRHHTLIQALISGGSLKESEFHWIFKGITSKIPVQDQNSFNKHLYDINKELSYVKFELRGCRNQYDVKVYYGLVNTLADEQSKLRTKYSVPQIAFYKAVVARLSAGVQSDGDLAAALAPSWLESAP